MARNVLQLVSTACYRSNVTAPTSLVGSTNASDLQLLHLFYSTGEELRALGPWSQLKRTFKVRLVSGQESYDLPLDFYRLLPYTCYDRTNSWLVSGPTTDTDWGIRVNGVDFRGNNKAFRLSGTGGSQFKVNPIPGDSDAGSTIPFDYISKNWIQPPPWTASEAAIAQNIYRSANGIIYKKTDSGTDTAGTTRPTMEFGEGQDGSCRWLALSASAFANTTLYKAGDYFLGSTRLYRVTVGGTSASTTPTSTTEGVDLTSGTVTYQYHSSPAWAGQTVYQEGDYVLISSQYYRCEVGGKSASVSLTWTPTLQVDNTIDWTFQDIAYETALLDTDFQVFDEELVIAELRAKLFQARGLGSEDLMSTAARLRNAALGRFNAGKVLDLAADANGSGYPSINWTGSNWTVS